MLCSSTDPALRARIASARPLAARAGSALVFFEDRLVVVQDDALAVAFFDPASPSSEAAPFPLEGEGGALAKLEKPDFESAFLGPGGIVTILGSGSTKARRRVARVDLERRHVVIDDLGPLYDAVEAALGDKPNLEGALLQGGALVLFHRGAGSSPSAVVSVASDVLVSERPRILDVIRCDLGFARGVPLHFTDATIASGRVIYLAVAEDTPNAVDDGPIVGAAVGIFEKGQMRQTILVEASGAPSIRKLEGIAEDPRTGVVYAVTDPDDPDKPAELCVIELEGFFGGVG